MPRATLPRFPLAQAAGLVAVSGTIAFLAGCGGSDSSSGGSGKTITASTGTAIFQAANCSSCHTLAAESATGVIGPNLDKAKPPVEEIVDKVTNGDGSMPSFSGRLTTEQIQTLAEYVASVEGQ